MMGKTPDLKCTPSHAVRGSALRRAALRLLPAVCLLLCPGAAGADVVFSLDLPMDDEAAARSAIEGLGGTVTGGEFGDEGWTTTSRDDVILVPLPAGLDASEGAVTISFKDPETDVTSEHFEQWIVLSLDGTGFPFCGTAAGSAGIQSLYRGFNPDRPDRSYRLAAYLNLHDPGCTDWHLCTGETAAPPGWITGDGTTFTILHEWSGPADTVTFSGRGARTATMDLSETSPDGRIDLSAGAWLMINACGGSTDNGCGAWGGPPEMKGGPLGVTYIHAGLELFGELPEDDADEAPEAADAAETRDAAGDGDGDIEEPADMPAEEEEDAGAPEAGDAEVDAVTGASPAAGCGCLLAPSLS